MTHLHLRLLARIPGLQAPVAEVFIPAFATRRLRNPTSDAARASREANHQLTFALEHSLGLITRATHNKVK